MRSFTITLTSFAACCVLATSASADVRPELRSQYADEDIRLMVHFSQVLDELATADTSQLSASQRARRAAAIDHLRVYQALGAFPKNKDFGQYTPYFVDAAGTRCAMAYLIEQSGSGELVARVARTANNAYVKQLAGDPELVAWLQANGLSVAEAARIQPSYEPPPCDPECRDDEQCVRTETGTECSRKCDPQDANACGANSACEQQLAGPVCYPPILAEGPRPDNSCAIAGGGLGAGFLLILGAILLARTRAMLCRRGCRNY